MKTERGVKNKFCNKSTNVESKGNDPIWKPLPVVLWLVCGAIQIAELKKDPVVLKDDRLLN